MITTRRTTLLTSLAALLGGCVFAVPAPAPSPTPAVAQPAGVVPPPIVARPAAKAPRDRWGKADVATRQDLRAVSAPSGPVAIAGGTKGTIAKTTDGGATWTVLTPAGLAGDDLLDVAFLDARTGWALGTRALYLTADGGETWTTRDLFADVDPYGLPGTGEIALVDYQKGAFVARGHVFTTTDGGKTFTKVFAPEPVAGFVRHPLQGAAHLVAVGDGYGLWSGGALFKLGTTAPAPSAEPVPIDQVPATWGAPPERFDAAPERMDGVAMAFPTPTDGWAVAAGQDRFELRRSKDGGRTWTGSPIKSTLAAGAHPTLGFPIREGNLHVAGALVFMIGRASSGGQVMAESKDAGATWVVSESFQHQLVDVAIPDATHGYAVGPGGQVWTVTSN